MKNLQIYKRNLLSLQVTVLGFCIDADNSIIYVVKQGLELLKISTSESTPKPEPIQHSLDHTPDLGNIEPNEIKLIEFVVESGSIFIVSKRGHVLRLGVSAYSPPSACFYKHPLEIESIKLSPDQDLIALADSSNDIHIIGLDGELLYRDNALHQNDSLHKPVGVGWGSKETQFFGLDGRPSREKQQKEQITLDQDELELIVRLESSGEYKEFRSKLERSTVIDWRGDGQYLATLTFVPEVGKHYLKVWNRNLELQYMSDQLVSIERDMLTWLPNGHFICCSQRRDRRINEIVMFEKNGLVHQRITLPSILKNLFIKDLTWSPSSKILAIVAQQFDVDGGLVHFTPILLLYTMQNFHYYLKFCTRLSRDLDYTLRWNPINHNRLHIMSNDGSYQEYICNYEVFHSEQQSTVVVIDANKVLVTPMQTCIIPPPMAAITLETDSPIYNVALSNHKATDIFIFTYDDKLITTNSTVGAKPQIRGEFLKVHQDPHLPVEKLQCLLESYENNRAMYKFDDVHSFQNITPINESRLIATRTTDRGCELVNISLVNTMNVSVEAIAMLNHEVEAVARNSCMNQEVVLVQTDGSVIIFDSLSSKLQSLFQFSLSSKLNFIELQSVRSHGKTALISLFQDMSLLFNDGYSLSTSCTSFRLTENYLIYTTTENHLHFVLLDRLWDGSAGDSCTQPIEIGATLIVASEVDARVVLQMPRGNLEILHPRVLIFSTLTLLLDRKEFVRAMQMARRHRVNMNFICDYILRMSVGAAEIIKEFAITVASYNPQMLSLFLTELDDADTIVGRYENIMKHLPMRTVIVGQKVLDLEIGKVQKVCTTIDLPKHHKYLQPRLLSLLKQTPKKTCEALRLVHHLDKHLHREALEFMLYFIDIDQLFLDALCTYNTDIALMVASVSHKDPKEYLALLDEFNAEKNSLLRAFKIDMHVKHYGDAFAKLLQHHDSWNRESPNAETQTQLRQIAVSKRIFKQALSCFKSTTNDKKLFEQLWADYGSYLLEKRCYLEAGLAYSKALELKPDDMDHFNKSLNCFSIANSSENAFALIHKLTSEEPNIESLVNRLLDESKCPEAMVLMTVGKFGSSDGFLDKRFRKNIKKFLDGGFWYLAEFLFNERGNSEERGMITEHVRDTVQAQISSWADELLLRRQQFDKLKELLMTAKSRASDEQTNSNPNFISDSLSTIDGSELSSTLSGSIGRAPQARSGASSIKTRNSSKSNKSQAQRKKRINLKPGSRYEDLALALELRRYILRHKSDQDDTMRLLAALFEYCYATGRPEDDRARVNSRQLNELLLEQFNLRQEVCSLLWPESLMNEQMFSLYRRFNNLLSEEDRTYESEEFEVLMRPDLPKESARFEL